MRHENGAMHHAKSLLFIDKNDIMVLLSNFNVKEKNHVTSERLEHETFT